jgi:xylulokinase
LIYAIGLDIGTTHIKAILLNEKLNIVKLSVADNRKLFSEESGWTYDPEQIWNKTLGCLKDVVKDIKGNEVASIGVTSMAEAGLPLDKDGNALYPIIPWYDMRAEDQMNAIKGKYDNFELYMKTGLILHPKYSLFKMLWLKENHRDLYEKTRVWLSVADYIIYRLSGNLATDESLAGRIMLYNIGKKAWDSDLMKLLDNPDILPQVVPLGAAVGVIQGNLAKSLGINGDTVIVAAGQDHLSAAYANCLRGVDEVLDSMGTSEVFVGLEDKLNLNYDTYKFGINAGCFTDGKYYWMTSMPASGASVEWLKTLFSVNGEISYDLFEKVSCGPEPGSLLYFPYLNGSGTPHMDYSKRGLMLGLSSGTDFNDLIKSVYEGTCYECRWIIESVEKAKHIKIEKIKAVGSALKNTGWVSIKSNIFGRNILCSTYEQDTAVGAALMSARRAGFATSFESPSGAKYTPGKEIHDKYDKKFLEYKRLYGCVENYYKGCDSFESDET